MRKILFLLLLAVAGYGQTSTGQEQEFDYGIKNNAAQTVTTPPFIVTQGIDNTVGKIPSAYIEKTADKISTITGYSETSYPNEKAAHDALDLKLNISDLPTNLTLYPTTVNSDVGGYVKMVTDIHDVDYNTVAVDVSTPTITGTAQIVSQRISAPGVLIGQPGVFNITTFGNIKRLSGTGTANFYFEVYHRDLAGTETLICTSSVSDVVSLSTYSEFTASGVWDDGDFIATDRIVIKTYANRIAGGTDPVYQFQFGGTQPVRTLLPVPFSVVDAGYEMKTNKSDSYTASSSTTYASTKALVDGLGTNVPKKIGVTYTPTISGQAARYVVPSGTNATVPIRLVIYCHGSSEDQNTPFTTYGKNITDELLQQGFIVAASYAHGNAWGNQASQDDYYNLYAYIAELYNIQDVCLIGQSMGGLASLNLLASDRIPNVSAWYGIYPVTNLNAAYYVEGFFPAIRTAYGFTTDGEYDASTAGFDPNLTTTSLFVNKKYTLSSSPDDSVVLKTLNSDLFRTKILSVAYEANAVTASGEHGDPTHFIPESVVSTFSYYPIIGAGKTNYLSKFSAYNKISKSVIFDDGTNIGLGTETPTDKLHLYDSDLPRLRFSSAASGLSLIDTFGQDFRIINQSGAGNLFLYTNGGIELKAVGAYPISFKTANTEVGSFTSGGYLKLNTTPISAAGTYDFLVRNTSNLEVEKVASNTIAPISSPAFTGTPTAPTAAVGTNTTQIATMAALYNATPYKKYVAVLTQTSTSAPTAKVLENTLGGTVVWTYSSTGVYVGTLTGAFTVDKSPVILTSNNSGVTLTGGASGSTNFVGIETKVNGTLTDGSMTDSFIEIRVYP